MRVGVDLDGVLYPFVSVFRDWVATQRGIEAESLPWPGRWDFYPDWDLSKREFYDEMSASIGAGWLFTVGDPAKGARSVLRQLRKSGHTVHVVTARHKTAAPATQRWLETHRLPVDGLHFTSDKTAVRLDAHIDDAARHYDDLDSAGVAVWLMDQAWNRHHDGRRVATLSEWCDAVVEHGTEPARVEAVVERAVPAGGSGEVRATDPATGAQKGRKPERFSLLPARALAEVARVYAFGADKYEPYNWRRGMPWSWMADAGLRHKWAWLDREDRDPESGLHHLAHDTFHNLGLIEFHLRGLGTDDRAPG